MGTIEAIGQCVRTVGNAFAKRVRIATSWPATRRLRRATFAFAVGGRRRALCWSCASLNFAGFGVWNRPGCPPNHKSKCIGIYSGTSCINGISRYLCPAGS